MVSWFLALYCAYFAFFDCLYDYIHLILNYQYIKLSIKIYMLKI